MAKAIRGRPVKPNARRHMLMVRVTAGEFALLQRFSFQHRISISELVRAALFDHTETVRMRDIKPR